jgi:hypothetical protein
MLYDLCLQRKASAKRDWVGQAGHVLGHQADADTLHDNAFERVVRNECGCLARGLHGPKWAIGAVRGKEGSTFATRWGWCRWFGDRDGKSCSVRLQDSLFRFLGGNTLKMKGTHS